MPFTQAYLLSVAPPVVVGNLLEISWTTSAPAGTWWQVYVNEELAWFGQETVAEVALPASGETDRIDVGSVLPGEQDTSFAADLPVAPARRAELSWWGGYWEGIDLAGWYIYGSPSPGAAIDYVTSLATVPVDPGGMGVAGWNLGPWNIGGWGYASGAYSWTSGTLTSGTWSFAVVPYDEAGNLGTAAVTTVIISAPPSEPPPFQDGTRLHYSLLAWNQVPWNNGGWSEPEAILTWNESTD